MAKGNFAKLLKPLLGIEGGIADRPLKADPGGLTNMGVTHKVYDAYRTTKGEPLQSVREITKAEVSEIYEEQYWKPVRGDELPSGVDWCVFDCAVNSGPGRAVKLLQKVLGCSTDGVVGLNTLKMLAAADPATVINHYCDERLAFLKKLKNWGANKNGWTRRIIEVRAAALDMANPHTPEPTSAQIAPFMALPSTATAKAPDAATAQLKTPEGQGFTAAGAGLLGEKARQGAEAIGLHVSQDTTLGRLAFVVFAFLTLIGSTLVLVAYLSRIREKGGLGGFIGSVFKGAT